MMLDGMSQFVEIYDCDFLICGDMNLRVGTAADFIENDYDRYVPLPEDYELDEGCQNTRNNQDKTINTNGRQLLDVLQEHVWDVKHPLAGLDQCTRTTLNAVFLLK